MRGPEPTDEASQVDHAIFRVQPPVGPPFLAVITEGKQGVEVLSNRDGSWKSEPLLGVADLLMPKHDFIEWTIDKVWARPSLDGPLTLARAGVVEEIIANLLRNHPEATREEAIEMLRAFGVDFGEPQKPA